MAMKDPVRLQIKLKNLLKTRSDIHIEFSVPCSAERLTEIAWVIQDYVTNSGNVINEDPLNEWLEEYHFFLNQ